MISYESLAASLSTLGLEQEAAEYHGILCGMLCYHDNPPEDLGLAGEGKASGAAGDDCLQTLRKDSLQQLQEAHYEFVLQVPDDEENLDERVDALALWVGGFLHGLATGPKLDLRDLSDDAQELVRDFTELSRAGLESASGEGEEQDELDYAELIEYVRVGAQLLFLELRHSQAAQARADDTVH